MIFVLVVAAVVALVVALASWRILRGMRASMRRGLTTVAFLVAGAVTYLLVDAVFPGVQNVCLRCGEAGIVRRPPGMVVVGPEYVMRATDRSGRVVEDLSEKYRATFAAELAGHEHLWHRPILHLEAPGFVFDGNVLDTWFWLMPLVPDLERVRPVVRRLASAPEAEVLDAVTSFAHEPPQPQWAYDDWHERWIKTHPAWP